MRPSKSWSNERKASRGVSFDLFTNSLIYVQMPSCQTKLSSTMSPGPGIWEGASTLRIRLNFSKSTMPILFSSITSNSFSRSGAAISAMDYTPKMKSPKLTMPAP